MYKNSKSISLALSPVSETKQAYGASLNLAANKREFKQKKKSP